MSNTIKNEIQISQNFIICNKKFYLAKIDSQHLALNRIQSFSETHRQKLCRSVKLLPALLTILTSLLTMPEAA